MVCLVVSECVCWSKVEGVCVCARPECSGRAKAVYECLEGTLVVSGNL